MLLHMRDFPVILALLLVSSKRSFFMSSADTAGFIFATLVHNTLTAIVDWFVVPCNGFLLSESRYLFDFWNLETNWSQCIKYTRNQVVLSPLEPRSLCFFPFIIFKT